jgi:hypothetical protein
MQVTMLADPTFCDNALPGFALAATVLVRP